MTSFQISVGDVFRVKNGGNIIKILAKKRNIFNEDIFYYKTNNKLKITNTKYLKTMCERRS